MTNGHASVSSTCQYGYGGSATLPWNAVTGLGSPNYAVWHTYFVGPSTTPPGGLSKGATVALIVVGVLAGICCLGVCGVLAARRRRAVVEVVGRSTEILLSPSSRRAGGLNAPLLNTADEQL
jgi:hypothetical protein